MGHLFIVRGNLTHLSCDAWLMPTDASVDVNRHWFRETGPSYEDWKRPDLRNEPDWGDTGRRVHRVENWPEGLPEPWLTNTGGILGTRAEWFAEGAVAFLEAAARHLEGKSPRNGRARHLLAMPLVGTGAGGAYRKAGEILEILMPRIFRFLEDRPVDAAIVLFDDVSFSAAQAVRAALSTSMKVWPRELDGGLQTAALHLADHCVQSRLVLFMGAGIGSAAGLPQWGGLLKELADEVGLGAQEAATDFGKLSLPDQAVLVELRCMRLGLNLGQVIADMLDRQKHISLSHALLAGLPVRETVTTNYDRLFELASRGAGWEAAVIPYSPARDKRRWLLKLHGCVSRPEDIVLTRTDYIRYQERRAALRGIVQAMLMTRHMLFVGFSLTDDNFHRIVDEVRRARMGEDREQGRAAESRLGTCLSIDTNRAFQELWSTDLDWLAMDGPGRSPRESARVLEIFLDYVGAAVASKTAHICDPRFEAALSSGDRALVGLLSSLVADSIGDARRSAAWPQVESMLRELGWKKAD